MFNFLSRLLHLRKRQPALTFVPRAGQLVSVIAEDGIAVAKLLVIDRQGVHMRLYAQRFPARPTQEDLPPLDTAPLTPETPFSIGHMPLTYRSFAAWLPEVICGSSVTQEELEGYRMWQEAPGGYF